MNSLENLSGLWRRLVPRSPLGMALGAALVLLVISPDARRVVRKGLVRALAAGLALSEEVRDLSKGVRNEISALVAEAQLTRSAGDGASSSITPNG
ncbi:hypothetical protein U7230_10980 [Carboxydochorda subterranea]|uniref:DUF5132 domain-containing protein n=1 Tax=Carboxydichorda subterranea TaxID=3109565 RepID=A0ABZ1BWV6_9FIRM|nr:hypothetical protein [Limnochorda sp. L945t]WRP16612.1 hypothetical protein U7230_10980 [Limnochorda sp. L945t]